MGEEHRDKCSPLLFPDPNLTEYVSAVLGERCTESFIETTTVVTYVVILFVGIIGNLCTCIVIVHNKSMHNPTNYYLMSLAVSDLLMLVLGLPMELYMVLDVAYPYRFGELTCKLRAFLTEFTSYASVTTICAFSVERWLAICFPLRIKLFSTLDRAIRVIIVGWVVAFISASPMFFVVVINRLPLPEFALNRSWTHLVSPDGVTVSDTGFCAMDINRLTEQKGLIYFAFFVFFMFPALLITCLYCHIAIRLRKADKYLSRDPGKASRMHRSRKTVLQVLVTVVILFFVAWLPFHLQRVLSVILLEMGEHSNAALQTLFQAVFYVSGYFYYSSGCSNPIVYNLLSRKFRRCFCRTILGQWLSRRLMPRSSAETRAGPTGTGMRGASSGAIGGCRTRERGARRISSETDQLLDKVNNMVRPMPKSKSSACRNCSN